MDFIACLFSFPRKCWFFFSGRYLNLSFIRFIAITVILIGIINIIIACWTSAGGVNIYGSWAGADYSCFYIAGKILNGQFPEKLYDFRLQSELLHSLLPAIPLTSELPYMNPPFFALIFKPLSCLPYMVSYCVWGIISIAVYVFSFKLFWKTLDLRHLRISNIALLLALSFEPFSMENIVGGNSSAVGFLACALFLYFGHSKKDLMSGMSLGLLLYKPTFLVIILPMLLIARRVKILVGFGVCSILLILLSFLAVGVDTCVEYGQFLVGVTTETLSSEVIYCTFKYVDIFSFSRLLFGNISPAVSVGIVIVSLIPIFYLIKLWLKLDCLNKSSQELLKASAITLTIIINVHFALYDTVILVLSILLTVNALYQNSTIKNLSELSPGFKCLLVALYILPWISQFVAQIIGLQLFTIGIAIMGSYQIFLARIYSKGET